MSNENLQQIKDHKEITEQVLYEKDFYTENENWKTYPKAKVKAEYVTYTWEYLDKDKKYQAYSWDKVVISIYKLTLNEWNVEILKKSFTNKEWKAFSKNDKKEISMSVEEFKDFITSVDLDIEIKKKTVIKRNEKIEQIEEVSIEDIPF